ncbi:type II secretion system F family protein [Rhodocyclus purpureus]|uniref:type II secretion system F family protein n=1 Tax=Rhodocyclus purpureus TaxID=1067 RepID=UPI0019146BBE|nr:type II secretion system F family protein [Rhodocyclus purpureus]MBK5912995.1 hypothetical protein [Rhodocyclus purpureus]
MDNFRYEGRNAKGATVSGQIESASAQAVAAWMRTQGLLPIRIQRAKAESEGSWQQSLGLGGKLTPLDLMLFTRQLGITVKAGVPMLQALAGIQKSSGNPRMAELMRKLNEDLEHGLDLSGAMARRPEFFDDYYVSMVRIGENSGQLEEILDRLYEQLEFEADTRKKIKSALRYPSFVIIALVIAVGLLSIFVIPVFGKLYASMKMELPLLTRVLIGVSDFAVGYWWTVPLAAGVAMYGVRLILATSAGRLAWDRWKLRLPVIGSILSKAAMARFCVSFCIASRSGVPIDKALSLVASVVDNAYYAGKVQEMRAAIERGDSILKTSQAAGIFKALELQMIAIGEESGSIDDMLEQVGSIYKKEMDFEVARLGESIEPIILVFIGGIVTVLMLGIFMPLWDMGQMAKQH